MSSASRGLAPREGFERLLVNMGRTGPLVEPHYGPQAGKSGDPRSQDADKSPDLIAANIPRVHNYALKIPWARTEAY